MRCVLWLWGGVAGLNGATETVRPAAALSAPPEADRDFGKWTGRDFIAFDAHYPENRVARAARLRVLAQQTLASEAARKPTAYSFQILSELIWLVSSTADFKRMDRRFDELEASLN